MKALFVHQNCPGQFRHLLAALRREGGHDVVFLTRAGRPDIPGVARAEYAPHRAVTEGIHPYLIGTEAAVIAGQGAARAALGLKQRVFVPDLIYGHPGWGETLFLKDVFPEVPLISYAEFYYRGRGSDVGFDPEFGAAFDTVCKARARAAHHLLAIEAVDCGVSPTEWQRAQFPEPFRDRIEVIHDGIDTGEARPDPAAELTLPGGRTLRAGDEIVTYVARNLEPYRGFHVFMRALPEVLHRRPDAHVVIVGGDGVSYGRPPQEGGAWREKLLAETRLASERVHFLGQLPRAEYLRVLQISAAHVYLTYPFVLSWSALEAMAAECAVIGSDTAPVRAIIKGGVNGHLVDFFDPTALAAKITEVLADRQAQMTLRQAARKTVLDRYGVEDAVARQIALMKAMAGLN